MSINGNALATPGVEQVVNVLAEQVLALCAEAPRLPSAVRASAGDVTIEVEWPVIPATTPVPPAAGTDSVPAAAAPLVTAAPPASPATDPAGTVPVGAVTVGTFYRAPEPGAAAFVAVGDTVRPGQQLAIIEAMKLMIPVESDVAGRVAEICVEDGTPVEHGQALMLLEPVS